ncbi:MAG: hypothetical protein A2855_03040 [Candidatus Liptonbacteria bacterium RIFCSPHIGHO2_01_FULL_57_28]|uniref:Uncharacterized protein n=1 Tax=Candidatus Liptonbacteria bacterium RIFCSPHIGHO2_01_FULL_57_28 TaxID=1798647 RepID=A0A1G2CAM0_9BACT|nr:MAG: hypothetical protein A2855_03040 [Candidatus Liptonbacteria bacterium RIFCSPHIGHO2_01_FULL_57_28]
MKLTPKKKLDLAKKYQKVLQTPAGYSFFVAIHDFVGHIEVDRILSRQSLPAKYGQLKQVYQGLEDTYIRTDADLGHDRYMTIQDLNRIQKEDISDSNPLWKKRELLRSLAGEVFEKLQA